MRSTDPDYMPPVTKDDIVDKLNDILHFIEEGDMTDAENTVVDLLEALGQ